jgi:hypothetical protein
MSAGDARFLASQLVNSAAALEAYFETITPDKD